MRDSGAVSGVVHMANPPNPEFSPGMPPGTSRLRQVTSASVAVFKEFHLKGLQGHGAAPPDASLHVRFELE